MRIGFDIDGIFADFSAYMYSLLKAQGVLLPPYEEVQKIPFWDKTIDVSKEVKKKIDNLVWNRPEVWTELPVMLSDNDVAAVLRAVKEHEVIFITSRPIKAHSATLEWLYAAHGLEIDNFQLICGAKAKGPLCRAMNIAAYVDDNLINAYEISRNNYTRSCLIRTPETTYYSMDLPYMNIRLVDSVEHYLQIVVGGW